MTKQASDLLQDARRNAREARERALRHNDPLLQAKWRRIAAMWDNLARMLARESQENALGRVIVVPHFWKRTPARHEAAEASGVSEGATNCPQTER